MNHESSQQKRDLADQNIERLLGKAYRPEEPDPEFAARVKDAIVAAAQRRETDSGAGVDAADAVPTWTPRMTQYVGWAAAAALLVGLIYAIGATPEPTPATRVTASRDGEGQPVAGSDSGSPGLAVLSPGNDALRGRWLSAMRRPDPPPVNAAGQGEVIATGPRERRRVVLADGSAVCLNENTWLRTLADRHVALEAGEIYLDVAPRKSGEHQASGGRKPPGVPDATNQTGTAGSSLQPPGGSRPPLATTAPATFVVETPARRLTALGTKFSVSVAEKQTDVAVVQGRVKADDVAEPLRAGQRTTLTSAAGAEDPDIQPAPRMAELLYWTRDLLAAAEPVLVPASAYSGGAVTVKSSDGTERPLTLRRYHVDVHIEDGFARTTIDQTYFNHLTRREEGTFHFPLPPDASISRLAMYVSGKLMEGGMVERDHGRNVFESIKYRMQDPALLEWIDGTTFKMRVFPLEPREEKRIILSYTQPLEALGAQSHYRFPIGHSLGDVDQFSVHVLVRGGADGWNCASHPLVAKQEGADLVLDFASEGEPKASRGREPVEERSAQRPAESSGAATPPGANAPGSPVREPQRVELSGDLELTLTQSAAAKSAPRFSSYTHEGHRYLMLRAAAELPGDARSKRRDWIFVVESSADRSPLLARAQIEIVRGILNAAGHDDTFSMIAAGTRPTILSPPFQNRESNSPPFQGGAGGRSSVPTTENAAPVKPSPSPNPSLPGRGVVNTPTNIAAACEQLGQVHLVGALDLEAALKAAAVLASGGRKPPGAPVIVHLGGGVPVLGERDNTKLAALLSSAAQYVGIAVGRSFNRQLMKTAAAQQGGYFTQINPNEPLAWRATDLVTTLNSPRLLTVKASSALSTQYSVPGTQSWLLTSDSLSSGETFCALTRLPANKPLPKTITLSGQLDGAAWKREIPVQAVAEGAGYLPRQWARLEIDRLLAADGAKHKEEIIKLSKAMYVMSPYTSLLVLENDAMYEQYKVDRGRKDHWAMYPAPAEIPVVREPLKTEASHDMDRRTEFEKAQADLARRIEEKNQTLTATAAKRSRGDLRESIVTSSRIHSMTVQDRLAELIDDFNRLRDQRRFAEAEVVAKQAFELAPHEPAATQLYREVRFWRNVAKNRDLSDDSDDVNIAAWLAVDRTGLPIGTDGLSQFGDVREWAALTSRRGGAAGFAPRISTLPPGADISEGSSVSIDRRYVRITALPFFSQVGPAATSGTTSSGVTGMAHLGWLGPGLGLDDNRNGPIDDVQNFHFFLGMSRGSDAEPQPDFDSIIDLIKNTISPDTWNDVGGVGTVEDFGLRLNLVTSGTPDIDRTRDSRGNILKSLLEVEQTFIPFPDGEPPVVYPSAEVWEGLTFRRGKYAAVDAIIGGQPSPYFLRDDVQYFLQGAEFPLTDEAGAQQLHKIALRRLEKALSQIEANHQLANSPLISELAKADRKLASIGVSRTAHLPVEGVVTGVRTVDRDTYVQISVGSDDGVVIGDPLRIYRGTTYLGRINVIRTEPDKSVGRVERDRLSGPIQVRDRVESEPPLQLIDSRFNGLEARSGNGVSLVRERIGNSEVHSHSLTDLLAFAPGMATSALDIHSVLEAEGNEPLPKPGRIDPKAAEMIAKARAVGWRSVELGGEAGQEAPGASARPLTIQFDGTGRFRYEWTTGDGLQETVVCDGANLWHVYPELGVAAQRKFSRVYRGALCRMLPWLLPLVEDLAIGADVTAIDERTVAITPRRAGGVSPLVAPPETPGGLRPPLAESGKPVRYLQLRLVFAADGQLEQQQLVEMPAGKVLSSVRFSPNGAVFVHDAQGKEIGKRAFKLAATGAPDVASPDPSLVVVPLPLRTQDELLRKGGLKSDSDPATWDDATAIGAAAVADGPAARKIIQKRFFARDDFRIGFYALLLRHKEEMNFNGQPGGKDEKTVRHPLAVHLLSPLARYIADRIGGDATTRPVAAVPSLGEGFLAELDQYGSLIGPLAGYSKLNEQEKQTQLDILKRTATEFVGKAHSPSLALHVGLLAEGNLKHRDVHLALADFWGRMSKEPSAGPAARYEKARQLHRAGNVSAAKDEFLAYHKEVLKAGLLPPIDRDFYDALRRAPQPDDPATSSSRYASAHVVSMHWPNLVMETAATLLKRYGAASLISLAWQCRQFDENQQADALVAQALDVKEDELQQSTQLLAANYYHRTGQLDKADALVMKVLTRRAGGVSPPVVRDTETDTPGGLRPPLATSRDAKAHHAERDGYFTALLWHWAAILADQRGRLAEAARRDHEALEIVYAQVPEKIDLQKLRAGFTALMVRYRKLAEATALPGQPPQPEVVAAIVAAADKWRSLDDTPDAACHSAAKVLRTLGAQDAAWQYLTTPLAGKAHESAPWVAMADQLGRDGEIDLAQQSYHTAWQSEPTNPEILLKHANLLRANAQPEAARKLYGQIATGTWQQPRFNSVQQQARQALEALK